MSVEAITAYLEAHPDGQSDRVIAKHLRRQLGHVKTSLNRMRQFAYIDRWDGEDAVWMLVQVPEDCPMPDRKAKP